MEEALADSNPRCSEREEYPDELISVRRKCANDIRGLAGKMSGIWEPADLFVVRRTAEPGGYRYRVMIERPGVFKKRYQPRIDVNLLATSTLKLARIKMFREVAHFTSDDRAIKPNVKKRVGSFFYVVDL